MKKFFAEFKEFISRGSVIDLAVGVVIGAAFQGIIKSLVDDIIMPFISLLTGGVDFKNWFVVLGDNPNGLKTLDELKEAGIAVFSYGNFIAAVIYFLILAFVVFLLIKLIAKVKGFAKKDVEEAPAEPTTKKCPFCCSEIAIEATRCPNCTSEIKE